VSARGHSAGLLSFSAPGWLMGVQRMAITCALGSALGVPALSAAHLPTFALQHASYLSVNLSDKVLAVQVLKFVGSLLTSSVDAKVPRTLCNSYS